MPFVAAVGHPPLQKKSSLFPRARYSKPLCHARVRTKHFRTTYKAAMCIGGGTGGRLRVSATFRTVRNLTDATIVRLWYGNKFLTATVSDLVASVCPL